VTDQISALVIDGDCSVTGIKFSDDIPVVWGEEFPDDNNVCSTRDYTFYSERNEGVDSNIIEGPQDCYDEGLLPYGYLFQASALSYDVIGHNSEDIDGNQVGWTKAYFLADHDQFPVEGVLPGVLKIKMISEIGDRPENQAESYIKLGIRTSSQTINFVVNTNGAEDEYFVGDGNDGELIINLYEYGLMGSLLEFKVETLAQSGIPLSYSIDYFRVYDRQLDDTCVLWVQHLNSTDWAPGSGAILWNGVDQCWRTLNSFSNVHTLVPKGWWHTGYRPPYMRIQYLSSSQDPMKISIKLLGVDDERILATDYRSGDTLLFSDPYVSQPDLEHLKFEQSSLHSLQVLNIEFCQPSYTSEYTCPFLSGVASVGDGTEPGEWREIGISDELKGLVSSEFVTITCIRYKCVFWDIPSESCSILDGMLLNKHIHDSHWHRNPHLAQDTDVGLGDRFGPDPVPVVNTLISEFVGNEDLDGNGEIYGFDFKIDPADPDFPPALESIENHPRCTATELVLWSDFLATIRG
ncbi:MAG: hypothetical protein U9Q67_04435, partial [Patescibacteria group bacterium]|nr:hypothetical protein [Patescibacteria group bacterium]